MLGSIVSGYYYALQWILIKPFSFGSFSCPCRVQSIQANRRCCCAATPFIMKRYGPCDLMQLSFHPLIVVMNSNHMSLRTHAHWSVWTLAGWQDIYEMTREWMALCSLTHSVSESEGGFAEMHWTILPGPGGIASGGQEETWSQSQR